MSEPVLVGMMRAFLGDEDSHNDSRFKFQVGQKVVVKDERPSDDWWAKLWTDGGGKDPRGHVGRILSRRNAYPPPDFCDYWAPTYFVDGLGEIGEGVLMLKEKSDEDIEIDVGMLPRSPTWTTRVKMVFRAARAEEKSDE